ncbi:hypothetical protein BUALT_Bualt19G0089900 [Buddleja alternifolia]|uniref:Uncharacterized protein n=1 Tax=Buddleja alternifolia TaxID=168488 RepID=A0AAV6W6L8_9LAMI|nr:hypothetical protein BUALT_Bualt19G0089900 [Buddleja alternifolia]
MASSNHIQTITPKDNANQNQLHNDHNNNAPQVEEFAKLPAGACSMIRGEFDSDYSQSDTEIAQMKRKKGSMVENSVENVKKEKLHSPFQASKASTLTWDGRLRQLAVWAVARRLSVALLHRPGAPHQF